MNWPAIRAKILDVVGQCVRCDTVWRDRERQFVRPVDSPDRQDAGVLCQLHAFATRQIGVDEYRQAFNSGTQKIDITQAGIREFTVSCLVESYDQSDGRQALEYTERIRSCIRRPAVLEMLRAVGLTCYDVSNSTDFAHFEDDHEVSSASIDLMFSYANNEHLNDGPGLEPLDYISTVEGTRVDPPGLDVPAPIDEDLQGRNNE